MNAELKAELLDVLNIGLSCMANELRVASLDSNNKTAQCNKLRQTIAAIAKLEALETTE